MGVNNWPKLLGVLVALVGLFALVGIGSIGFADAEPFLYLIIGYLVGNGVAARKGDGVTPIIGRRGE